MATPVQRPSEPDRIVLLHRCANMIPHDHNHPAFTKPTQDETSFWPDELHAHGEIRRAAVAERFLLEGPRSRASELGTLGSVVLDFLRGFRTLHFVGPCVTVFGSARTKPGDRYYELARRMGGALAKLGFTVMTGGGPGIMEAANQGAKEVGGRSVGCNIELPFEQDPNPHLDRCVTMKYFFVRKTLLIKYSYAFVVLPGGAGTLDELFEAITLIQTGKIENFPVVLMGTEYWREMLNMMEKMAKVGTISPGDLQLIYATDSVEDAIDHIKKKSIAAFGLKRMVRKPSRWLGEHGIISATEARP